MPRFIILSISSLCLSGLVFLLSISCSEPSPESTIETSKVVYKNQHFDIVKVDLRNADINFFWKNDKDELLRSIKALKSYVESDEKKLLFAMNGGMYQRDRTPQGIFFQQGQLIHPLDTLSSGHGNFYLQPNGVFLIHSDKTAEVISTTDFTQRNILPYYATQSGPMLLINGQVHPAFRAGSSNLNIRNGVGIISKNEVVFAISNEPVNFYDFAMLFKEQFHCENALYLDGFVSRAYIPSLERYELDGNFGVMIGVSQ